jgi:16S rRNA (adenine1518-N6/adenine1519-N6)-dimethyltransferase
MERSRAGKPFAKKSFGQNFLVDPKYVQRIVDALALNAEDTVVEIGAGRGALTEILLEKAGKVYAIELDRDLIPVLRERFGALPNFELVDADALTIDFSVFAEKEHKPKLVANLPYNISTVILQRLIEYRFVFSEMILMFQREVAHRISARPGNSERGSLTVLVEAAFSVEKLFDVSPKAFIPQPKVVSAIVRLYPRASEVSDEQEFRKLLGAAFAKKRKTIGNNLKTAFGDWRQALDTTAIDANRRAETLTMDEWLRLHEAILAI